MFIITNDRTVIDLDAELVPFVADAFTSQSIDMSWTKTTHAVANGFSASDAITINPKRITLSGCVAGQALNQAGEDIFEGSEDRVQAACNFLERIGDARECLTVNAGFGRIYQNMVLISAPIQFDTGGVISFDLLFEEIVTFGLSETFDASLGEITNIGEVSTASGQPAEISGSVLDAQERLRQEAENPVIASICENECGTANAFCLDACYARNFD